MKQPLLLILGVLFVINIFFRVRVMKLMKQIKEHELLIQPQDFLSNARFYNLTNNVYPDHAELLVKYRNAMMAGLGLIVAVVVAFVLYFLIQAN